MRLQKCLNFGRGFLDGGWIAVFGDNNRYFPVGSRRLVPCRFQNHYCANAFATFVSPNFPENDVH